MDNDDDNDPIATALIILLAICWLAAGVAIGYVLHPASPPPPPADWPGIPASSIP